MLNANFYVGILHAWKCMMLSKVFSIPTHTWRMEKIWSGKCLTHWVHYKSWLAIRWELFSENNLHIEHDFDCKCGCFPVSWHSYTVLQVTCLYKTQTLVSGNLCNTHEKAEWSRQNVLKLSEVFCCSVFKTLLIQSCELCQRISSIY